jgi:hypothetical protein
VTELLHKMPARAGWRSNNTSTVVWAFSRLVQTLASARRLAPHFATFDSLVNRVDHRRGASRAVLCGVRQETHRNKIYSWPIARE